MPISTSLFFASLFMKPFTDLLSLSMTGCGVLAGTSRPIHADSTTLLTPPSLSVGISGAEIARFSLSTPSQPGRCATTASTGPHHARPAGTGEVAKLRHELLSKEVKHLAALTRAETPAERVAVWSGLAADLHAEAKLVYKAAPDREMASLSRMYERTVTEGVVAQAKNLPPALTPAERLHALADADGKLQAAEAEAEALSKEAPPAARGELKKMAGTAKAARAALQSIIRTGA